MRSPNPKISIVMPVFNSEATILRAINSVKLQTRTDWELIIVDDASTDNTRLIVEAVAEVSSRIKIIYCEQNLGVAVARNQALNVACGRYIAFLDSDDEWLPLKLEKQIGWMEKQNHVFTCTSYQRIRNGDFFKNIYVPRSATRVQLLKNNTVGTLTAAYDREWFRDDRFPILKSGEDYALWLDFLTRTSHVYGLPEVLARYHIGHASLSSNKILAAREQWQFLGRTLRMNFFKKIWYFGHYAINASKRYF